MEDKKSDVLPYEPKSWEDPTKSNVLTEEQKAFVEKNFKQMKEPELYEKLAEYGTQVHRGTYGRYLREVMSKNEDKVFSQKVSEDELNTTIGGFCGTAPNSCDWWAADELDRCTRTQRRYIYKNGFPNCAATVEDGSWCWDNDACYTDAVLYQDMVDCAKAWR